MSVGLVAVGRVSFVGHNGIGSISVPGLKVGDLVGSVFTEGSVESLSWIENTISVDDQLQQTGAADMSTLTFTMIFFRAA